MSHTAHIPSHRKPRRSASKTAIRSGVAGGVLSTIALAGAAAPATAEPVTETIEMPTLTSGLAGSVAQSAAATQQVAADLELQAQEDAAAAKAANTAKKAKAEAERKAEAKAKAEKAARAEAAQERASRSEERTTLSTPGSSAPASYSNTQATGSAAAVLAFARAQVGDAYVLGSTGPNSWDCSSLVQAAYRQAGIDLPRTSQPQSTAGTQVSLDNLQPGDILYWGGAGSAYHVGIYSGGGKFIGAQNSGTGVVEKTLDWDPPTGAVRLL